LYDDRVARRKEKDAPAPIVLRFSGAHLWVRADGTRARIGLSDFGQEKLGEILAVDLPGIGETIERGDLLDEIESVRTARELPAPVTGTVTAVNEELADRPELVNEDPYHEGWLIEVVLDEESGLEVLMPADEYEESLASEEA
jgi:glycine cleavage system H protein